MGEEVAPQIADHPLAEPRHQVEARARGDRQHRATAISEASA